MMSFERYNKFIKDLCFNKHWPMASVANAYSRRVAAAYQVPHTHHNQHIDIIITNRQDILESKEGIPQETCTLTGKERKWEEPCDTVVRKMFGKYVVIIVVFVVDTRIIT